MRRYWRILTTFWTTALAAEMEYRANFAVSLFSTMGNAAGSLVLLNIIFVDQDGNSAGINGWQIEEAIVVMGMFTFLEGIAESVLTPNLSRIVNHVREGTLDFVLLKPVDSQVWLSTRNLSTWGLPSLLMGIGLIIYGAIAAQVSAIDLLIAVVPVCLAVLMIYSLWFILGATSIWFVKIYNATEVLRAFMEAGRYPLRLYPATYQFVLMFVVPVGLMTTVPAETVLGRVQADLLALTVVLTIVLLVASRAWWRFALRHYTSASS